MCEFSLSIQKKRKKEILPHNKNTQNPSLSSLAAEMSCRTEHSRNKGWGVVKFNTNEEAISAIAAMNATECGGCAIEVRRGLWGCAEEVQHRGK